MLRKTIGLMLLLSLAACSSGVKTTNIASLYSGHEQGSWYHFSKSCSATLCPPN